MKNLHSILFACLCTLSLFTSCSDDENGNAPERLVGLSQAETEIAGTEIYEVIVETLMDNEAINIIAEINHTDNAQSIEMTLPYTRVILFGNPKLGTPLMQENMLSGLDLPQKILVTETEEGTTQVTYNDVSYLMMRHNLTASDQTDMISNALSKIVSDATGTTPTVLTDRKISSYDGIEKTKSGKSFDDTYTAVKNLIKNNPNLKIIAELDHKANAASVDMELGNSKLIVFGNPNLGSPLMAKNQLLGLDLPQKMLVYHEGDDVYIAHNDVDYLLDRYEIIEEKEIADKIEDTLDSIADTASE